MKKIVAVAKINFRTSRLAYMIFLICLGSLIISTPINALVATAEDNYQLSPGSFAYLLVLLFCVFVPALHFRKFMNLNVKKADYLKGCAASYVGIALAGTVLNTISYFTLDRLLTALPYTEVWNLIDVFGWSANGIGVAILQQFAFLLLVASTAHLITSIQTFAYGWVVDIIIVAILSVFIPIPFLRQALLWFFGLIIFTPVAIVQIVACLALAALLFLLSILPVKNKPV